MKNLLLIGVLLTALQVSSQSFVAVSATGKAASRHECAAAVVGNNMYLLGGRGKRPVDRFNLKTNHWDSVAPIPLEINHFQAAVYKHEIFIAGAFTGQYPHEKPVKEVYAFNTKNNTWRIETIIPAGRMRGAAASVIHNNKLYLIDGIQDGHYDGHVSWMDVYDFKTKTWSQLADAPHARDHISGVVVQNKIYLAGGRTSSAKTNQVLQLTVPEVDVYDIEKNSWSTLEHAQNIPTQRAGCTAVPFGHNSFVVIGGESGNQIPAHSEAEVFDVHKMRWTKTLKLLQGRHGTQAVNYKNKIYIAAGSANRGGGPELNSIEACKVD